MDQGMSYSGFTPDDLSEALQSVRAISTLPDAEALTALDKLLASLRHSFVTDDTPADLIWLL